MSDEEKAAAAAAAAASKSNTDWKGICIDAMAIVAEDIEFAINEAQAGRVLSAFARLQNLAGRLERWQERNGKSSSGTLK